MYRSIVVPVTAPLLSAVMSRTLFGHKRGAFTGAVADAIGKVEEAEGGTLFLDEVGDLVPDTQARLLRMRGEGGTVSGGSPLPP
jgi:two-component system, NtrC family, response regulator AlgB